MKPVQPTVPFAVRTARGERRRIKSFLKQVQELGVGIEDFPPASVRALEEADRFLGRYLDLLARETPSHEQLEGVMEALGGIDRVVKNAMAEILKSLGWRPEEPGETEKSSRSPRGRERARPGDGAGSAGGVKSDESGRASEHARSSKDARSSEDAAPPKGGKVIPFPGPRTRRPVS